MNLRTCRWSIPTFSRAMVICGVSLCFAAAPAAFAQRGGSHTGGHVGGGAHFGGFNGHGGARGAAGVGMQGARASSGGRASAGAFRLGTGRAVSGFGGGSAAALMPSRSGASTRGYTREVFASPGATSRFVPPSTRFVGTSGSEHAVGARVFAANNYLWEAPPQERRPAPTQAPRPAVPLGQMPRPIVMPAQRPLNLPANPLARPLVPRPVFMPMPRNPMGAPAWRPNPNPIGLPPIARGIAPPLMRPLAGSPLPRVSRTPLIGMAPVWSGFPAFHPMHPIDGIGVRGCFNTIGNCGFGFGFGGPFFFPPLGFGFGCFSFFNPCGIGFGPFGMGFGDLFLANDWGNGWFYPPAPEIPPAPVNPTESNPPPDYSTGYLYLPEVPYAEPQPAEQQKPTTKLVLKDGTIFDVYSYWLEDDRLYYITTYNIQTSIPIDDLDLQKTVDLNQKLGVTFTLSNKPPEQEPLQEQ